ncbi:MAG: MarR family winged helix-turn-helix transcriptional regulator [Caldilineaceae bacterium]
MNTPPDTHQMYSYLERINSLVRAQEQNLARQYNLQPAQLRMLYYLGICNRYSDTPAGVTDYLQLTKGTVSQSLKILAEKGYVEKRGDEQDKRQVHLALTASGLEIFAHLPPDLLVAVGQALGEAEAQQMTDLLRNLLSTMQYVNGLTGFEVCRTCTYHRPLDETQFCCGLTNEILTAPEAQLICREHIAPTEPA